MLKESQEMEELGIIEPSCSDRAFPIVAARKKEVGIIYVAGYFQGIYIFTIGLSQYFSQKTNFPNVILQ